MRITIDRVPYTVALSHDGISLQRDEPDEHREPRLIPWAAVAAIPVAWAVVCDGVLQPKRYALEVDAADDVTYLRGAGCVASVVRIAG
jgi:hypothetical protein